MDVRDTYLEPEDTGVEAWRRFAALGGFVLAAAVFGLVVYALTYRAELEQAVEQGRAELALAADRLASGLQRYRELGVILADHPFVAERIANETPASTERTSALFREMADKLGAQSIQLVSNDRDVLAVAGDPLLALGSSAAIRRARTGALGMAHFVDDEGRRKYVFAAPVFSGSGPAQGAVIVSADVSAIEWGWPTNPEAVYFTDDDGVVFASNRSELILRRVNGSDWPVTYRSRVGDFDVWSIDAGPYIPDRALHVTQPLPVVGLKAEILKDLSPVVNLALLQAGMAAAFFLAFGAFLFLATERRRALAEANQRLEMRVAERTRDLEVANRELTHEVTERQEAEARLKRAQADLVQAGKLSALGEMSAGISHELNQPLMAIRSFAENAQAFLEREKPERAAENLGRISELAYRMARIIKNLRAFARQDKETVTNVELGSVVEAALEMTQAKISRAGVTIDWERGANVWVRGGDVRLQQVVMNLLSNAVDAMSESAEKRITITLQDGSPVRLSVADTGSGISEPERIFDPFYTTKEVGTAKGLGLGLSISYGLMQSFGGKIKGANRPEGGAVFTIELKRAEGEMVA